MARVKASLVSVYLLREGPDGLEVLLLQRGPGHRFPGDWQGVHGHIEPGEAAWQAALRETAEETGIEPTVWFRLIRVGSFYEPATDAVYLVPAFVALAPPGAAVRLSGEHEAAEWRPPAEARERFRWATQRDDMDGIIAGTGAWPRTGPELERMDVAALRRRWARRAPPPAAGDG
ncbi:MAG: NUDIX domain-containing protein [Chloroflexota bacterium]|nr:NUDIX domain-containing protein [Chloroflexota bacterium]